MVIAIEAQRVRPERSRRRRRPLPAVAWALGLSAVVHLALIGVAFGLTLPLSVFILASLPLVGVDVWAFSLFLRAAQAG